MAVTGSNKKYFDILWRKKSEKYIMPKNLLIFYEKKIFRFYEKKIFLYFMAKKAANGSSGLFGA